MRLKGKPKFYHASPFRFHYDDILTGNRPGGYGSNHSMVCMTDSPVPHITISNEAITGNWMVYEVLPIWPVSYNNANAEFQTRAAKVIKFVGLAKTFSRRGGINAQYDNYGHHYVSCPIAIPRRRIRSRLCSCCTITIGRNSI